MRTRLESLAKLISDVVADRRGSELIELADRFDVVDQTLRTKAPELGLTIVGSPVYDHGGNLVQLYVAKGALASGESIEAFGQRTVPADRQCRQIQMALRGEELEAEFAVMLYA